MCCTVLATPDTQALAGEPIEPTRNCRQSADDLLWALSAINKLAFPLQFPRFLALFFGTSNICQHLSRKWLVVIFGAKPLHAWTDDSPVHLSVVRQQCVYSRIICGPPTITLPDSKVHGANMGPIWVRQDSAEPPVGPMNIAIWAAFLHKE